MNCNWQKIKVKQFWSMIIRRNLEKFSADRVRKGQNKPQIPWKKLKYLEITGKCYFRYKNVLKISQISGVETFIKIIHSNINQRKILPGVTVDTK